MKKSILVIVIVLVIIAGVIAYIVSSTPANNDVDVTPTTEEMQGQSQVDAAELLPTTPSSPTGPEEGVDPNKAYEPDPPAEERQ